MSLKLNFIFVIIMVALFLGVFTFSSTFLFGSGTITSLFDGNTSQIFSFSQAGSKTGYFKIPASAVVNSASVDLNGLTTPVNTFWLTQSKSAFDKGTYNQTDYNTANGTVGLTDLNTTGEYTSDIFDANNDANWNSISWTQGGYYQQELPDNGVTEPGLGGVNMTGNVLLLHLDENSGTDANDTSGKGNDGNLINNPTWTSGKFKSGLSFDGVDDYVEIPDSNSLDITGNITIGAWMKKDKILNDKFTMIMRKGNSVDYQMFSSDTGNHPFCGDGSGWIRTKEVVLIPDMWYYFVCSINGTDVNLYANTKKDPIYTIGDSITAGHGGSNPHCTSEDSCIFSAGQDINHTYQYWLDHYMRSYASAESTSTSYYNKGHGSQTCDDIYNRFNSDIPNNSEVILMCGINDLGGGSNANEVETDINQIYNLSMDKNDTLVLLEIIPDGEGLYCSDISSVNSWMDTFASNHDKVSVVKLQNELSNGNPCDVNLSLYEADKVHPNILGYKEIARQIWMQHYNSAVYGLESQITEPMGTFDGINLKNAEPLWIGTKPDLKYPFKGTIDEISIWNRSLSAEEIQDIYKRGILDLNLSVRGCDDASCSGESWTDLNDTSPQNLSAYGISDNKYFQYKFVFNTENTNYSPELADVNVNYTGHPVSTNVTLDVGEDSDTEWSQSGIFDYLVGIDDTNTNPTFTSELNAVLSGNCDLNEIDNTCKVPFVLTSDSAGDINVFDVNIETLYVDLAVENIRVNSTVAGTTSTVYCDINNLGDANATNDYNVLLYVDNVFTSYTDITTDLNAGDSKTVSLSWTPTTAKTYDVNCVVDYNVDDYKGYDANIDNNILTKSITITPAPSNNTSTNASYGSPVVKTIAVSSNEQKFEIQKYLPLKFKYKEEDHTIKLKDVNFDAVTVVISSTPKTYVLVPGVVTKADLDDDNVPDVALKVDPIENLFKVNVTMYLLPQETESTENTSSTVTDNTTNDTNQQEVTTTVKANDQNKVKTAPKETEKSSAVWWIVIGVVILAIIVGFVFKVSKNKAK